MEAGMQAIWTTGTVLRNIHTGTLGILMSPWTGLDLSVGVLTGGALESWAVIDVETLA
jgi:hypothetical protein